MKFLVPYKLNDRVMTDGRIQSFINSIEGEISIEGVKRLIYSTDKCSRLRPNDIKKFDELTESDYKEISINPPFNIGDEVLYYSVGYSHVIGVLKKGKIEKIEFSIGLGYSTFWYRINGKNVDRYNIYKDKEEFIKRNQPRVELKGDERYFLTRYLIQQNFLVPKKIMNRTKSHSTIDNCGSERIRNEFLFTSKEKFFNKMFANL